MPFTIPVRNMRHLTIAQLLFVVCLLSPVYTDQLFEDNLLTFGRCGFFCDGDRDCLYAQAGKLYPCYWDVKNCLCVPSSIQTCTSSTQCVVGERCVHTNLSVTICVACDAAEYVPSFTSIDFRSEADCGISPQDDGQTPSPNYDPLIESSPSLLTRLSSFHPAHDVIRTPAFSAPLEYLRAHIRGASSTTTPTTIGSLLSPLSSLDVFTPSSSTTPMATIIVQPPSSSTTPAATPLDESVIPSITPALSFGSSPTASTTPAASIVGPVASSSSSPSFMSLPRSESSSSTPEYNVPSPSLEGRGYAFDPCDRDADCQGDYICRNFMEPLLSCGVSSGRSCRCGHPDPAPCTHENQCLFEEYCVNSLRPPIYESGVCISKSFVLRNNEFGNSKTQFFPPSSNPFSTEYSDPSSSPMVTSEELIDGIESRNLRNEHISSVERGSREGTDLHALDSDAFSMVTESFSQAAYSTPNIDWSTPSIPDETGKFTLDRCLFDGVCQGNRLCVNAFDDDYVPSYCFEQCYCVPKRLQSCDSSSECVLQEACVSTNEVEGSYCVSWKAIDGNPAFQVIPFDDGSTAPPDISSYTPPASGPAFTPFTASTEPRYIPPGFPTFTPSPEAEIGSGLTLSKCKAGLDCSIGYACVAVNEYWPCSILNRNCYCVPNAGKKGTTCIDDAQCPIGEICFPKRRIDIVPSYCVSQKVVNNDPKILKLYLSVIVPRGFGASRFSYGFDWVFPQNTPENAGSGSKLTGDLCETSADCEGNRLCANPLSSGDLCYNNCSIAYCYPRFFEPCSIGKVCDTGEACTKVFGMYASNDVTDFYSPGDSVHAICLSLSAIARNGYEVLPYASLLPRDLIGYVVWENAVNILKILIENNGSIELFRMSEDSERNTPHTARYFQDVSAEQQALLKPHQDFVLIFKKFALAK